MTCLEVKKNEGEQIRRRESNLITLFGSFLRKKGEGFEGVSTTSNSSFLISPVGTQVQIYIVFWALFEEVQWSENRSTVRRE